MSIARISQSSVLSGAKNNRIQVTAQIPYNLSNTLFVGRGSRWAIPSANASGVTQFSTNSNTSLTAPTGALGGTTISWVPELRQIIRLGGNAAVCQAWDPTTNVWTTKATPPITDMQYSRGGYDPITRKVYVFGMTATAGVLYNYAYDPFANTWSAALNTGTANVHIFQLATQAVWFNGKFYMWGGNNSAGTQQDGLCIYDPSANTWSTGLAGSAVNNGPGARAGASAGLITAGTRKNKIAILGGNNISEDRCYFYDPIANTWTNPGAFTGQLDSPGNAFNAANYAAYYHVSGASGRYMHIHGGDKAGSNRQVAHGIFDTETSKIYMLYRGWSSYLGNMIFLGGCMLSIGDAGFVGLGLPGGMIATIIADSVSSDLGVG